MIPQSKLQLLSDKVSGPLLDRIDIHSEVTPVPFKELTSQKNGEKSEKVRERVVKARKIQAARFQERDEI